MKNALSGALKRFEELFDPEDDPREPAYDPVHLAAVLIVWLVSIGCLYWLLWTALVYEGGFFLKARAGLDVLLSAKTLKDYGYEGSPYAMGVFEGWFGNAAALLLSAGVVAALYRLYRQTARRHG